ncbi:hypothetical protein ACWKSP_05365 [Micromonosporaceae bacterium Da 78-11]
MRPAELMILEQRLSAERLAPYRAAAGGDLASAIALYDRGLWHPCLHRVFPKQRRRVVEASVGDLHTARNRMAHHEPMFNRQISDVHLTAMQVAGWICPVSRDWIRGMCRVPQLLSTRPIP